MLNVSFLDALHEPAVLNTQTNGRTLQYCAISLIALSDFSLLHEKNGVGDFAQIFESLTRLPRADSSIICGRPFQDTQHYLRNVRNAGRGSQALWLLLYPTIPSCDYILYVLLCYTKRQLR